MLNASLGGIEYGRGLDASSEAATASWDDVALTICFVTLNIITIVSTVIIGWCDVLLHVICDCFGSHLHRVTWHGMAVCISKVIGRLSVSAHFMVVILRS